MNFLSLDVSRNNVDSKVYGIIFKDSGISEFLYFPRDYTMNEISLVIKDIYENMKPEIILDSNGCGIQLEETLKALTIPFVDLSKDILKNRVSSVYTFVTDKLTDIALNSNLNFMSQIQFKKMINEFNNLDPVVESNIIKLKQKDTNIGKQRVTCLLQYLYFLFNYKL